MTDTLDDNPDNGYLTTFARAAEILRSLRSGSAFSADEVANMLGCLKAGKTWNYRGVPGWLMRVYPAGTGLCGVTLTRSRGLDS